MKGVWADVAAWLSVWRKAKILDVAWADLGLPGRRLLIVIKNTQRMHEALAATRPYVGARHAIADIARTILPLADRSC